MIETGSKLLGTPEQRRVMYDSAPHSHKLGGRRTARRAINPPYDGRGNLPRYVRLSLAGDPILRRRNRDRFKRLYAAVERFYDMNGVPPTVEDIRSTVRFVK